MIRGGKAERSPKGERNGRAEKQGKNFSSGRENRKEEIAELRKDQKKEQGREQRTGQRIEKRTKHRTDKNTLGSLRDRKNSPKPVEREIERKIEYQQLPLLPIPDFRVSVEREEQLEASLEAEKPSLIYLDEACFPDSELASLIRRIHECGKRAGLRLRRISRSTDAGLSSEKLLRRLLLEGEASSPEVVLVRCMEEVMQLFSLKEEFQGEITYFPELNFDYTIYGYNGAAASVLREMGAERLTLPIELNKRELSSLRQELFTQEMPAELLVYGHLPMMVSANCIEKTSKSCDHKNRIEKLRDRMGKDMPVRMYCKYCYNQIYNAEVFGLLDLPEEVERLHPESIRYDFSVESGEECRNILAGRVPTVLTRGHFRHGVE